MRRRGFIAGLSLAAMTVGGVHAEEPIKPARVGIISFGLPDEVLAAFGRALADKGYVEGQNLVIEERFAEGHSDRLAALVVELLTTHVDVLYAPGTQAALAAKSQTRTVPIVFQSGDPVSAGLVTSLAVSASSCAGRMLIMASGIAARRVRQRLR